MTSDKFYHKNYHHRTNQTTYNDSTNQDQDEEDLSRPLHPLTYYSNDKDKLLSEAIGILHGRRFSAMIPPCLKNLPPPVLRTKLMQQLSSLDRGTVLNILDGKHVANKDPVPMEAENSGSSASSTLKKIKKYLKDEVSAKKKKKEVEESISDNDEDSSSSEEEKKKRKKKKKAKAKKKKKNKLAPPPPPSEQPASIYTGRTLMELLELEYRAKAIKALLKTQDVNADKIDELLRSELEEKDPKQEDGKLETTETLSSKPPASPAPTSTPASANIATNQALDGHGRSEDEGDPPANKVEKMVAVESQNGRESSEEEEIVEEEQQVVESTNECRETTSPTPLVLEMRSPSPLQHPESSPSSHEPPLESDSSPEEGELDEDHEEQSVGEEEQSYLQIVMHSPLSDPLLETEEQQGEESDVYHGVDSSPHDNDGNRVVEFDEISVEGCGDFNMGSSSEDESSKSSSDDVETKKQTESRATDEEGGAGGQPADDEVDDEQPTTSNKSNKESPPSEEEDTPLTWYHRWYNSKKVQSVVRANKVYGKLRSKLRREKLIEDQPQQQEVEEEQKEVIGSIEEYESLFGRSTKPATAAPPLPPEVDTTAQLPPPEPPEPEEDEDVDDLWGDIMG